MNEEPLEHIERQIAVFVPAGAPATLRSAVLADVQRELRAARWDRRLARAAVVLLVSGVGLNATSVWRSTALDRPLSIHVTDVRPAFVDTAAIVAEASDAATAQQITRQIAAMTGRKLTDVEEAAINAVIRRAPHATSGDRG